MDNLKQTLVLSEAIEQIIKNKKRKFDETIAMHINLGIDTSKSDQNISSWLILPNDTKIVKKIVVITNDNLDLYKKINPYKIGNENVLEELIKKNDYKYDYIITKPELLVKLGKYGKNLGSKGLLPSLKKGTVSPNLVDLFNNLKSKQISIKNDKDGIIHASIGKVSLDSKKLIENANEVIKKIKSLKKPSMGNNFIKSIYICSTMGKSVKISL